MLMKNKKIKRFRRRLEREIREYLQGEEKIRWIWGYSLRDMPIKMLIGIVIFLRSNFYKTRF